MMLFPSLCVDNFYDDPYSIVEYAKTLQYYGHRGNYPGERSDSIHELNPDFFDLTCMRLFSLFYNFNNENVEWNISMYFQRIYPYSENKDDVLNSGWCHLDDKSVFAGVIYLNEFTNIDAGTVLVKPKKCINNSDCRMFGRTPQENCCPEDNYNFSFRNDLYSGKKINVDIYREEIKKHNEKFETTLEFKNVFNRAILYDGSYRHRGKNFYIDGSNPRLTLVFFANKLKASSTPISRKNNINFKIK